MEEIIQNGSDLDAVKKSLAYGKEPGYFVRGEQSSQDCSAHMAHMNKDIVHAILGIVTEATELAEALLISFQQGTPIDEVNLLEEIGDIMWYQAVALNALGKTFERAGEVNICLLYTSPSPRDQRGSRMPSSA